MRKFLLITFLFLISAASFSQDTNKAIQLQDTSATKKALDNAQHFLDSLNQATTYKDVSQGIDNLVIYQNERRAKQKKQAFLYIGLGLFFLVILIVGLRRRVKK